MRSGLCTGRCDGCGEESGCGGDCRDVAGGDGREHCKQQPEPAPSLTLAYTALAERGAAAAGRQAEGLLLLGVCAAAVAVRNEDGAGEERKEGEEEEDCRAEG